MSAKRKLEEQRIKNLSQEEKEKIVKRYCEDFGLEFVTFTDNELTIIDRRDSNDIRNIVAKIEISPKLDGILFKEIIKNQQIDSKDSTN